MIHMLVPGNPVKIRAKTEDYLHVYECGVCGCKFAAGYYDNIHVITSDGSNKDYFICPTCNIYRICKEISDPKLSNIAECISMNISLIGE